MIQQAIPTEPTDDDEGEAEAAPVATSTKRTVDSTDLCRRYDALKAARAPVEGVWAQIERYFFPLGTGTQPSANITEGAVDWNRWEVWDSTAIDAAQKLAASIHGSVTSPSIRWFKLQWRDEDLKGDTAAASWLDLVGDSVFDCLQDSDFNTEIASADQDLVGYGNTVVVEEPASATEWKGVDFEAVPIRECYFEQDSKGGVERFYRRLYWSPVQVRDLCRRKGWACPEKIEEQAEQPAGITERVELVFCVFVRPDGQVVYPAAPHIRPVGWTYFLAESGEPVGEEGGYYEMPVMLARWQKTSGSQWGHGPCTVMLPTVKYLNAYMETDHQAAAKVVDPATLVTERGLLSDLDLEPGGVTVVRDVEKDIKIHESKARFDVSERKMQELRAMVQRGLHNDELTLKDSPAMTAQEVRARYELMNRVLGSTLARIENDLLSPIVKTTIGHLFRANQLPPLPPKVQAKFDKGGADFNIEYQGPLARSQRTDEVAAIERVLSFAAALLKMGLPLKVILATLDVVEGIREIAKRLGTPAALLKPPEEVKKALAAMDEMEARAAQAQVAQVEGAAAEAHGKAAQARAAALATQAPQSGGAPQGGLPVPAQPQPVVSPAYGPVSPFRQAGPPAGAGA